MKQFFVFMLFFASVTLQAQDSTLKKNDHNICIHDDESLHYYDWHDVETAFAKQVNIPAYKCNDFFVYAFSQGYLKMQDYRELVKSGVVTKDNALHYWLSKLPSCELIYKNEYQSFISAKQNGNNTVMASCNNLDFANGTTSNWSGEYNDQGTSGTINGVQGYGNLTQSGFYSGGMNSMSYVQEICTAGNDPNVPISRVPPGHTYSIRLGSDSAYQQNLISTSNLTYLPFFHQTISNTFLVTPSNKTITYWYAVCLTQNATTPHPQNMQPYFKIRMYDGSGNEIMCAHYDVDATSASSIGGFQTKFDPSGVTELLYKNWSPVLIPLSNYVGQNVTITFETSDCAGGGHSGIAYLAIDCAPLPDITIVTNKCNNTKTLTAPSGLASYSWSGTGGIVGPTNLQSVNVNTAGTYSVTMTTLGNSGVTCTLTIDTTITAPPPALQANFAAPAVCVGNPTQFSDISVTHGDTVTAWHWDFGDGSYYSPTYNPSHTYAHAGSYLVSYTITTNHGCIAIDTMTVHVNVMPVASFTAPTVCLGSPTVFNNTTVGGTTYNWNFGDGVGVSTLHNPSYTYVSAGTFNVTYTVSAGTGCSVTYTNTAVVNPSPVVAYTAASVCKGAPNVFNNTSSGGTSYSWDFGDGSGFSTIQNPTYTYAASGNFIASLSVTNSFNCTIKFTDTVIVHSYPVVAYTSSTACLGLPVNFTNNSTPAANVTYSWNFGDGSANVTAQSPTHTYNTLGTYTTSLTVTSVFGCATTNTNLVTVNPIPSLAITSPLPVCSGVNMPVPSYTINPNNPATTFTWTNNNVLIGLGTSGVGMVPNFISAQNTTTTNVVGVIAVIPTLNGCVGPPTTETVTIKPTPIVSYPTVDLCPAQVSSVITFTAIPVVPPANILWMNTSSSQIGLTVASGSGNIPSFAATNNGTSAISNVISVQANLNGCYGPVSTFSITANPNPFADFSLPTICDGNPAHFVDHSTIGSGSVTQWGWDMDYDGIYAEATVQNPIYLLSPAGNHTISLQSISDKGCTDTVTKIVFVNPSPVVSFTGDSAGCTPYSTMLSAVATVAWPQYIKSWIWNLGNGTTYTQTNGSTNSISDSVLANYINSSHTQNAYFTPSIQVTTDIGCTTAMIKNNFITVYPQPKAGFSYDPGFADIIDPTIYFHDQSVGAAGVNAYVWNFGDVFIDPTGDNSSNYDFTANPTHTYSDEIPYTYSISQMVQNTYGCRDSVTEQVVIHPAVTFYIPNAFSPNNDGKNEGFKGTGIGINNSTYNLWIYDRWGNMIFHATDIDKSWDGRVNNELVLEDTYVWKVDFYDDLYQYHEYKGTVTVVR